MDKAKTKSQNSGRAFMDIVGSAHYAYNNRYLVDFSLSGSASSILDPDDRWGIFPAIGAGWILSEENFMKRDWLNLLKVRASYGISGRADYGVNLFQNIYGSGNSYYFQNATNVPSSSSGMKFTQLGIDGLTYEKSHKLNVGIDFRAWNKLTMTLDAFYDLRTDILVSSGGSVSQIFGMSVPQINLCIGGSALAVAFHLKDKAKKGMISSFGITALCGVTEPAFYGSLIMRPKCLIGTAIGAVCSGLIAGIFGLQNYVVGGCPGLLSFFYFLPADGSTGNIILYFAVAVVAIVVSFVATSYILKKTDTVKE